MTPSFSTSFEVVLAGAPALLDLLLATLRPSRKASMATLGLVSQGTHDVAVKCMQSFSLDLQFQMGADSTSLVRLVRLVRTLNLRPRQLRLTLPRPNGDPGRCALPALLRDLGPDALDGISHLELIEGGGGNGGGDVEETVRCALSGLRGLTHVSLIGRSLLAPCVGAALCVQSVRLTRLTISQIPLGPALVSFLHALHPCVSLQTLDLDLDSASTAPPVLTDPTCKLPPSVQELHMNAYVSVQVTEGGFLSAIRVLTVARLPASCKSLNRLLKAAPVLRDLTLTAQPYQVTPDIFCGIEMLQGLRLTSGSGSVALYGSCHKIREILEKVCSLRVETCYIVLRGSQPELDPAMMRLLPDRCPGVKKLVLTHFPDAPDGTLGYLGDGAFLAPLAGCRELRDLEVSFRFPGTCHGALCGLLLGMPALTAFRGVVSDGLQDAKALRADLMTAGRAVKVKLDKADWMNASCLWHGFGV